MSRNLRNKFPVTTFLMKYCVMAGIAIFMGVFLLGVNVAYSQTVGEVAKLPEAKQLEIVMQFVNNAIAKLPSHTDSNGKQKSEEEYTNNRIIANLVRAMFIQDPKDLVIVPIGPRVMLVRIKKYATEAPDRTVLDVTSELVDWCFQHFYVNFFTPEKKAEFAKGSDAYQETNFRLNIALYEADKRYDRTIKALEERQVQNVKEAQEIYDRCIVLSDGRHVMTTKQGDFIVSTSPTDEKNDYRLEKRYYPEAQYLYDCLKANGMAGQKGSDYCRSIK